MKNKLVISLLLFIVVLIPVSAQNNVYFDPQQSTSTNKEEVILQIWMDSTDNTAGGQMSILFDPSVVNVTKWQFNSESWSLNTRDSSVSGKEWITFASIVAQSGKVRIGDMTIKCITDKAGSTELIFGTGSKLVSPSPSKPLEVEWTGGNIECMKGQSVTINTTKKEESAPVPSVDVKTNNIGILLNGSSNNVSSDQHISENAGSDNNSIITAENQNRTTPEKETPGFEVVLALTGLFEIAYLLRINKSK